MSDPQTRRFFLGALTAASAVRVLGANDKVNVGIVGLGGRGSSHLNTYTGLAEAQVVGLCDVNQAAREKAQATLARKNLAKANEYEDMRQMFADPKIEAVSIATPNHWHALSAIWAMKAARPIGVPSGLVSKKSRCPALVSSSRSSHANDAIHPGRHAGRTGKIGRAHV